MNRPVNGLPVSCTEVFKSLKTAPGAAAIAIMSAMITG